MDYDDAFFLFRMLSRTAYTFGRFLNYFLGEWKLHIFQKFNSQFTSFYLFCDLLSFKNFKNKSIFLFSKDRPIRFLLRYEVFKIIVNDGFDLGFFYSFNAPKLRFAFHWFIPNPWAIYAYY